MREFSDHYEEDYLYLADLTHDAVLIAWGKFFFNSKMKLLKDEQIHMLEGQHGRHTSIGGNCESYGMVTVEVLNAAGGVKQSLQTDKSYAWITGLDADTEYTYRVLASEDGGKTRAWGDGPLYAYDESRKELVKMEPERKYERRFRTFPDPAAPGKLVFAVIGDSGTGEETQAKVAKTFANVVAERGVRLVIMVGDTIYNKSGGSGDDDFEWLTTYFQPYRTIIDHIPFYPCMGNHDTNENLLSGEKQEDRLTLYDNFLVTPRFVSQLPPAREASISPGLFYRFRFGADIEFICLDTSKEKSVTNKRLFEHAHHKLWVEHTLTHPLGTPRWRIPFSHHPPYCKGPEHNEDETRLRNDIIPVCQSNGIRTFLSGHEHNYQCIDSSRSLAHVRCFVSGGAGTFRKSIPDIETDGFMHSWGGNDRGHFLIVTISGNQMQVEPIGEDGQPLPLHPANVSDPPVASPIIVTL